VLSTFGVRLAFAASQSGLVQVSFILSLFNQLPLTQACVASLRATVPAGLAHEIVLIDDGSTDGTRDWLQSLGSSNGPRALAAPVRIILNEHNVGFAASNNRAAREAHGDILFFLNSDLELLPGWFEPMLAAFTLLPAVGLVGNLQRRHTDRRLDHRGVLLDFLTRPRHDRRAFTLKSFRPYSIYRAVTAACCAIRRETFFEFGGFDESYRNGYEDIDLCLCLEAAGRTNYVANRSVVLHHVSASPDRFARESDNLKLFLGRWGPPNPSCRLLALSYLARYWFQPWRYNGPKLLLAFARLLTNRPCESLIARWHIKGALM
jgi:GT2 family glycosyltransferase